MPNKKIADQGNGAAEVVDDFNYAALARRLVSHYSDRNKLYRVIDDMFYVNWELPEGMPDWVQEVKSTDPRDAVMTAARVLSTLAPQFHVNPMYPDETNREEANKLEQALKWNYTRAAKRGSTNPHWQAVLNSVRYAQPVIQVVYLPYQEAAMKEIGKKMPRQKARKKYGDFSFLVHDPANVYPLWSDFGLEAVLVVRLQTADEFKRTWGKLASKIDETDMLVGNETYPLWVSSYDLWTNDRRIVWGVIGEGEAATKQEIVFEGVSHVMLDKENDLGFIPFAVRRWGDDTAAKTDEQVLPLLSGIAMSNQWDLLNILFSLDATLAWKRAAKPIGVHSSPTKRAPEIDATEPITTMEMGPGETFTPLPPESVDQHVASQYANIRQLMWQGTVARALQSLEFPANTAYSTVNQVIQAATSSISPYRVLAEEVIAEAAHLMLCWLVYWGESGHDATLYANYKKKDEKYGDEILISWRDLDPYDLDIEVVLRPDAPIDRQQQVNTAAILYERFPVTADSLLEEIGIENMNEERERRYTDDLGAAYIQAEIMRPMKELEFEFQAKMEALRTQLQQAMIAQQQEAAQNAEQNAQQNAENMPMMENLGGLGNNPAQGGGAPIQGAPGMATREASPRGGR